MSVGRPRLLTRDEIASTALALVDRDGLDALTMQRVAAELGVGTMTLYGYVRSKGELLDAVIDAATAPRHPLSGEGSWRDQLRELIDRAHELLHRHPALVQIRMRQPVLRPDSLRFGEAALRILHGAGLDSDAAAKSFRLLFTYVHGYAALSPAATAEDARRQAATAIAALPAERFPHLRAAAAEASAAMAGEEAFRFGLELILDGIEARL
jgi:AcrR family transcriptional regulator